MGQEYSATQRAIFLKDNCYRIDEIGYMKQFSPEEITEKKDALAEVSIEINDIEEEKKVAMTEFKEQLKPLTEHKSTLLGHIKKKAEFVTEECFKFVDHADRMVGFYNHEGILVEARPMRPDESQLTMKLHTGTNN